MYAHMYRRWNLKLPKGNPNIPDSLITFVTITAPSSPVVYMYETVVSKEPVGQGYFLGLHVN